MRFKTKSRCEPAMPGLWLRPTHFAAPDVCLYCSAPANGRDHVVPRSAVGEATHIVPSCLSCNAIAGNKVFGCASEKQFHIRKRLRVISRPIWRTPVWDEDELEELEWSLRTEARAGMVRRNRMTQRLRWMEDERVRIALESLPLGDLGSDFAASDAETRSTILDAFLKKIEKLQQEHSVAALQDFYYKPGSNQIGF